jgi:peroxiredoxin Q/BCP
MNAPNFSLPDQTGKIHSLSGYKGKWVILYTYPKDDTPGCTTEACNFRNNMGELKKKDIVVLGLSKDSVKSHQRFVDKFSLNFPLLSDESTDTIRAYGAWKPKKFMGKEFLGTARMTFLINPKGEIVKTYEGMDLTKHAQEIFRDIVSLSQ